MAVPSLPEIGKGLGTIFPPTWIVIDNGTPADKALSEQIVDYLMTKMPPVFAMRREVLPDADPDPLDLMAHGVIIVGGPAAWWPGTSHWHLAYMTTMDPGWKNKGTETAPDWYIVQKAPVVETNAPLACVISSCMGAFPWLTVFNVAGISADASKQAAELFCAGETKGIWINKVKQGA